ncbi:Dihydrofolate reductase [Streptomyces sp. DvalAA-14]|uniref:dihydrofolate reductase family protein n=1 Tax=unclassified Streptomyces TaxID=2593676 RepID=UPI00081B87DF|nr:MULTISPECIES: dihydrofolate reductase family protein [unclassified Streptomyces]SCD77521.1 Dihydrofolate reductase [Streptomyces sp. DvalAA-14]
MGLVHIEMFATLDLVAQAPGGPGEDPVGFPFGGWQAPLVDEVSGAQVGAAYEGTDALLLGRRTYDIFAAHWPHQEGGPGNEIATLFNSIPKYVASRGRPDLSWAGSTQLGPDLVGAVREIRDRHEHVKVVGSLNLVQTLLREKLFDRLDLWLHPIVLGVGKKVFDGGAVPTNVTLLDAPAAGPNGIVYLRYGLADGTPGTGDSERTRSRCRPRRLRPPGAGRAVSAAGDPPGRQDVTASVPRRGGRPGRAARPRRSARRDRPSPAWPGRG